MSAGVVRAEGEPRVALSLNWMRLPGAESCIDAGGLARSVERHLGREVFVSPTAATRIVEAWVAPARPGWHVALRASDANGHPIGQRELTSPEESCTSLNRAIVIAVGLLAQSAEGPAPDAPGPSSPLEAVRDPLAAPAVATPTALERTSARADTDRTSAGQAEVGPAFDVGWGVLPNTAVGLAMRATMALSPSWMIDLSSDLWMPDSTAQGAVKGSFSRADLAVGVCPVVVRSSTLRFGLCAGATAGVVTANGAGSSVETLRRPVFQGYGRALGLLRLASPVWLTAAATLAVPTTRWTFYHRAADGSDVDLWRMPAMAAGAQLGVMLHFGP